jgi:hypothetical protein
MRELPSSADERLLRLIENAEDIDPGLAGLAQVLQEVIEYLGDKEAYEQEQARAMGY